MKRYRKRPVIVEAIQVTRENLPELKELQVASTDTDYWITLSPRPEYRDFHMAVQTLEGVVFCREGSWLIKGIEGEYYPCKDSIFRQTYEEVAG